MIEKARSMLASYNTAMTELQGLIDDSFVDAVTTLASLESVLIITGLGKSGLVGQKAAATFSSTGTPSAFVHPVEALHGDLGIVQSGSAMLAISKGGGNEETIEFARQYRSVVNGPVITLTEPASRLEDLADIALHIPRLPEIDEWDLAPTTSTMTSMAVCDVLAICTQQSKDLTADDFAQFHPSGTLGKRLLLNVGDLMISGTDLPIQGLNVSFADLVYEISSKGMGMVLLTEKNGDLFGVLTDGDIRRLMARDEPVTEMTAAECFQASRRGDDLPKVDRGWTTADTKAIDCLSQMQRHQITSLVILEGQTPIGLVRMQDLVTAGL